VCGIAAGLSALLVLLVLRADPHHDADELAEAEAQQYSALSDSRQKVALR